MANQVTWEYSTKQRFLEHSSQVSASHTRQWCGRRNRLNWNRHSEHWLALSTNTGAALSACCVPSAPAPAAALFFELVVTLVVGETEPFLLPLSAEELWLILLVANSLLGLKWFSLHANSRN